MIPIALSAALIIALAAYLAGRRERDPDGTITALRNQLAESERLRAISRDTYISRINHCIDNGCIEKGPTA